MCLVRISPFYFSAALLLYPTCCLDHRQAPLPSCFPSPLLPLWWHHHWIPLALPGLVLCNHPLALALPAPLSHPHCHRHHWPISLPFLPTYFPPLGHIPSHCTCQCWCQCFNSKPLVLTTLMPAPSLYVPCLALWSTTTLAPPSHINHLNNCFLHHPFPSWMPLLTLTSSSPYMLIVVWWFCSLKLRWVVDSPLWLRI